MTGAEDSQFSVPLQELEKKSHFWGPCSCFESRKDRKNRITPTRIKSRFAAVTLHYDSVYRFEHIVSYSSGKVVAKSDRARPLSINKNNVSRASYSWKNYRVFLTTVESRPRTLVSISLALVRFLDGLT